MRAIAVIALTVIALVGPALPIDADGATTSTTAATRPNIVIVLADDLDTHSLGRMVDLGLMPQLKAKVIDPGTQFRNSFVTTSWCCPSRATPRPGCIRTITTC